MNEKLNMLLSNDINESLHFIKNSVNKMESLLKGMLKVSRLTKNKMEISEIKMNQMITGIFNNFDYSLKTKNIEIEIGNLPDCRADVIQINQVFSNIIDNAIKYYDPMKKSYIKINGFKKKA